MDHMYQRQEPEEVITSQFIKCQDSDSNILKLEFKRSGICKMCMYFNCKIQM